MKAGDLVFESQMKDEDDYLIFFDGDEVVLPDTHEWIDITPFEERSRGELHIFKGLIKKGKCLSCGQSVSKCEES